MGKKAAKNPAETPPIEELDADGEAAIRTLQEELTAELGAHHHPDFYQASVRDRWHGQDVAAPDGHYHVEGSDYWLRIVRRRFVEAIRVTIASMTPADVVEISAEAEEEA